MCLGIVCIHVQRGFIVLFCLAEIQLRGVKSAQQNLDIRIVRMAGLQFLQLGFDLLGIVRIEHAGFFQTPLRCRIPSHQFSSFLDGLADGIAEHAPQACQLPQRKQLAGFLETLSGLWV